MRTILTIAGWAVATCALALAFILPVGVNATSPAEELAAKIAKPKLLVNGCQLSLRSVGLNGANAANPPALELVATNPGKNAAKVEWAVALQASRPAPPDSRSEEMSTPVWNEKGIIALKPGETKVIALGKVVPTTRPTELQDQVAQDEQVEQAAIQQVPTTAPSRASLRAANARRAMRALSLRPPTYTVMLTSGKQTIEPISFALPVGPTPSATAMNDVTRNGVLPPSGAITPRSARN